MMEVILGGVLLVAVVLLARGWPWPPERLRELQRQARRKS